MHTNKEKLQGHFLKAFQCGGFNLIPFRECNFSNTSNVRSINLI
jgi:hypothetical protein